MEPREKRIKLMCYLIDDEINDDSSPVVQTSMLAVNLAAQAIDITNHLFILEALEDDVHLRIRGWYEDWIEHYLEYDFYRLFRMSRSTCETLVMTLGQHHNVPKYQGGANMPTRLEKQVLIFINYLSTKETLFSIGNRFNLATKTVYFIVSNLLDVTGHMVHQYIRWPTENECVNIERDFHQVANFPGVIGAIDGCHFIAKIPTAQHDSYQDRHFHHSISMQAICLRNLLLSNISVGYPGSLHDSRILSESTLFKEIDRLGSQVFFYDKYHLVGDSAYPCKEWLLTPYRGFGPSRTFPQKNIFCPMTNKKKVHLLRTFVEALYTVQRAVKIIQACCFLHNFCIKQNDFYTEDVQLEENQNDNYVGQFDFDGDEKRDVLCELLSEQ